MSKPIDAGSKSNGNGHNKNSTTDPTIGTVSDGPDIVGTDGNDYLDYRADTQGLWIDGGLGNDTILGGSGDDILQGGRNSDYLDGGNGSDTYLYQQGDNADCIVDTGTGAGDWDVIELSGNSLMYVNALSGIEEIHSDGTSGVTGYVLDDTLDFSNVVLNGVAWVGGGDGNDTIIGNDDANTIYGNAGEDVIFGNGGNDVIVGGTGADTLTGGEGSDTFVYAYANEGGDTITDFQTGDLASGGDVLDLSQIVMDNVSIVQDAATPSNAVVTITSGSMTTTITLEHVDVSTWTDANWIL